MYYQSYREKKNERSKGMFNLAEFDKVMAIGDLSNSDAAQSTQRRTKCNWIGHQIVNQYLCALRSMIDTQCSARYVTLLNENLMTEQLKGLMRNIKLRKETVFKLQLKERVDGELLPFKMLIEVPKIESYLWNTNSFTKVDGMTVLRNRFHYIYML